MNKIIFEHSKRQSLFLLGDAFKKPFCFIARLNSGIAHRHLVKQKVIGNCLLIPCSIISQQKNLHNDSSRTPTESKTGTSRLGHSTVIGESKQVGTDLLNDTSTTAWDIDFNNSEDAYKNKSTWEVFRAMGVFQICRFRVIVENSLHLSMMMQRILGKNLFERLMKMSFYGHFVAGRDQEEIKECISKLQQHGVGAILDYAVEEDLSEEKAKDLEMESCTSDTMQDEVVSSMSRYKAHRQFGDRRRKVMSARTYFYEGEAKCDETCKIFLKCIEAAGAATDGGFAAIKLTALGRPQFLLQFSEVLIKARQLFETFSGKHGSLMDKKFDADRFEDKAERLGILISRDESRKWFTWMDRDESGFVDLLDWNELIAKDRKFSRIFKVCNPETNQIESLLPILSSEEEAQMKRMLLRVDSLAKRAVECNVRLMIDAEQTYFQPAISRISMEMMRKFNKNRTIVMNTYQCYLKEAKDNLLADLALAKRENFHFGLKLVRGAYMEHERERAEQVGYENPIQPTYDDTNRNYNEQLGLLLNEIHNNEKVTVMVASHNEDSVKYALQTMHQLEMSSKQESQVYFGQLLGMCDYITFPLGHAGHHVFKYVPFGPVREVLPYLYRRAQENRSVLSAAKKERALLWGEIWRRFRIKKSRTYSSF